MNISHAVTAWSVRTMAVVTVRLPHRRVRARRDHLRPDFVVELEQLPRLSQHTLGAHSQAQAAPVALEQGCAKQAFQPLDLLADCSWVRCRVLPAAVMLERSATTMKVQSRGVSRLRVMRPS